MTIDYDGDEYETEESPAKGDHPEAIRTRYCLENDMVYEDIDNDYIFTKWRDGKGDKYLCFATTELDTIRYKDKMYFIKKIEN